MDSACALYSRCVTSKGTIVVLEFLRLHSEPDREQFRSRSSFSYSTGGWRDRREREGEAKPNLPVQLSNQCRHDIMMMSPEICQFRRLREQKRGEEQGNSQSCTVWLFPPPHRSTCIVIGNDRADWPLGGESANGNRLSAVILTDQALNVNLTCPIHTSEMPTNG